MENFFKELYVRITSETPEFFKKLRSILIVIAAISSTLTESGVDFTIYGYNVTQILAFSTVFATIITFLAVKDKVNIEEKIKEIKEGKK